MVVNNYYGNWHRVIFKHTNNIMKMLERRMFYITSPFCNIQTWFLLIAWEPCQKPMLTTISNEVWRFVNVKNVQNERTQIFANRRCGGVISVIRTLVWRPSGHPTHRKLTRGRDSLKWPVWGRKEMEYKTSSFATRINLIPFDNIIHIEGGMASDGSESATSETKHQHCNTSGSKWVLGWHNW